ncbi:MAG: DUF4860 domain-containing protein [Butyrivibrio sp.]|uniref:DUF4860 domain-containing protein n=1 Tax=Butyrivibrio sp. TaxID=28121 RepID=UPI001EBB0AAB|nr:DUF4860 domain-containing protein [Butyrivibrio sp.]MBE5840466.1 DUF4860 domain-containing protein [Butyrivibrio sp.]
MKLSKKSHVIDAVFILCLMFLFVLSALAVITIGANIYKKNVSAMSDNYSHRIASAYVTEKVRQADNQGRVYVEDLFDQHALVLQDEIDGVLYNTYIYSYDGYLMELYARADLKDIYPQSGQKILEITSFNVDYVSDSLLSVNLILKDGDDESMFIARRSEGI